MNVAPQHPLGAYGLDMLARGAARLRGGRLAVAEHGAGARAAPLLYRDLDALALGFAARVRECDLAPGARALIVGANRIGVVVALMGALAAGLEPVLVPAHVDAQALSALARETGATSLFGALDYGGADWEAVLFETAAGALDVRVVGALSGGTGDMADFSPAALAGAEFQTPHAQKPPRIGLARLDGEPGVEYFRQSDLVAEALDLIAQLALSSETPILATLSPASRAGLVAGTVAALLSGAPLHLFGPFEGARLLEVLDDMDGACLAAPAEALKDFAQAGALDRLACLALRGDFEPPRDFAGRVARIEALASVG